MNTRRVGLYLGLAVGAAMVVAGPDRARGEDWPQFRGSRADNVAAASGLLDKLPETGPRVVWETRVTGGGDGCFASPVVAGGRLFVMSRKYVKNTSTNPPVLLDSPDILYCLDAKSGKEMWKQEFKANAPYNEKTCWNTPAVDGELVYARGPDGELRAITVKDGKTVWSWTKDPAELEAYIKGVDGKGKDAKPIRGYGLTAPSLVVDDVLILPAWGGFQAKLFGLDKKTGAVLWDMPSYGCWQFSAGCMIPVDLGGKKAVAIGSRLFDPKSGAILLNFPGAISWVATGSGNRIVLGHEQEVKVPKEEEEAAKKQYGASWNKAVGLQCLAFSTRADGTNEAKQAWEMLERDGKSAKTWAGAMIVGDVAYMFLGGNDGNRLVCVQMSDGKKLWQLDLKQQLGYANAVYADGKIYYAWGGILTAIPVNPKGAGEQTSVRVSAGAWATPAVADGLMYLRDDNGGVKCLDLRVTPDVKPAAAPLTKVAAADWTQAEGPFGNGAATDKGLLPTWSTNASLKVLWEAKAIPGASGPVVAGDRVFLVGRKDWGIQKDKDGQVVKTKEGKTQYANWGVHGEGPLQLVGLDRKSGQEVWKYTFQSTNAFRDDGPYVTPVVDDGKVYALDAARELVCLNAVDGKVVWKLSDGESVIGGHNGRTLGGDRLTIAGDRLLCVGRGGDSLQVTALNKATGELLWAKYVSGPGWDACTTPRLMGAGKRECLLQVTPAALVALDGDSRTLWSISDDEKQYGPYDPAYLFPAGNRFLVNRQKGIEAYEATEGAGGAVAFRKLWVNEAPAAARAIIVDDRVFQLGAGNDSRLVKARDVATGKLLWDGVVENAQLVGGIGVDGKLILLTNGGELLLIPANAAEFKIVARTRIPGLEACWSLPAYAGGQLFLRDCAGTVKCIDLKAQ